MGGCLRWAHLTRWGLADHLATLRPLEHLLARHLATCHLLATSHLQHC